MSNLTSGALVMSPIRQDVPEEMDLIHAPPAIMSLPASVRDDIDVIVTSL